MAIKSTLILSILLLLLLVGGYRSYAAAAEEDEDLSFLEEADAVPAEDASPHNYENYDDLEDKDAEEDDEDSYVPPVVDEKDVVLLKESNFSDFVATNKYVLVEFYAPWCGHCKALTPEYAAAATELKDGAEKVVLAKVDATEDAELAKKYEVKGFPTLFFFVDGIHKPYTGQRTKDSIVTWVNKKTGPALKSITTTEEAEKILAAESKVVLGFLDALSGSLSDELAAVSNLEDDVNFYQTSNPDVAKHFQIDPQAKRPALVLIKKEAEKINHFSGQFTKAEISEFVYLNKLPLVTNLNRDTMSLIFENPIKNQLILFATSSEVGKYLPTFQEAAKAFLGKILFVYIEKDNKDIGTQATAYFGAEGDAPRVIAFTGNDDARKFLFDGDLTVSSIKSFGEKFLQDELKPFYKSAPIPEKNDGDVKIIVGDNFDEIVLDESKDVLLEIYAPWCGHCKDLEPKYNKLAKRLRGIDSLVIAKMDGTTNEHERAKNDGFPTILFFPAGNKSFEPIIFDGDRTVTGFYKFIKKHAAIPFKLKKKPAASSQTTASNEEVSSKDEL